MKQPRFPLPRGRWCSNFHLQNHWVPRGQVRCFNLHPKDAPPEWDPWAVKKTLQLSSVHVMQLRKSTHGRPALHIQDILASASSVKLQNSIEVGRRVWM
ncbi:hypothetical protein BDBG_17706 [Blastomyces gilchristii SLH14081]|uniref:Uncharacterized protein n=1 Tax=Blastomyces gilchristii (strain SLH14081) TaxID=559298 RepID=A0A179UXN4_BLAGS|nr:uncharacterized protein BDBG_17706 [Blastomyces gilchristii SLH14081]OAT12856.1 hypothetical protein BDBG_17706 [Blastomyces gilchristii SLH14081]